MLQFTIIPLLLCDSFLFSAYLYITLDFLAKDNNKQTKKLVFTEILIVTNILSNDLHSFLGFLIDVDSF